MKIMTNNDDIQKRKDLPSSKSKSNNLTKPLDEIKELDDGETE